MKARCILNRFAFLLLSTLALSAWADPNDDLIAALEKNDFEQATRIFSEHEKTIDADYKGLIQGIHASVLWVAAYRRQWPLVTRILDLNPKANVDAAPEEGKMRGATALWTAAFFKQWPLVSRMLELNPKANVNATAANSGITALCLAAGSEQWPLVTRMLELDPKANVDAAAAEGPDRGKTALWIATYHKQWPLVTRMLELNPKANVNAGPAEGPNRGATVLLFAARFGQWALVTRMLELNPKTNVDATPGGDGHGLTVLSFVAAAQQWPLLTRILELNPNANVDAALVEGRARGKTVLWLAAMRQQWPLVTRMLWLNPMANVGAKPAEGADADKDVTWYVRQGGPLPLQKFLVIREMNRDVEGQSLESRLKLHLDMREAASALKKTFRKVTVSFTNMIDDSGIPEGSGFDKIPNELKIMFVLKYLRTEDPDLRDVSDDMLLTLLRRFHKVYKDVDYKGRSIEVVAAKVLDRLAPIQNREDVSESRIKTIKKVRAWIIDEITDAMKANVLPQRLDQNLRDQLADALSSKSLSTITRTWVSATVAKFAEQQRREQAPELPNLKKRERGEEGDEPHEDESTPKAQVPE